MTDVCSICLEALSSYPCASMPGCTHQLHTACLINSAQYDVRCPVCRRVGDGVRQREAPRSYVLVQTGEEYQLMDESSVQSAQQQWREYLSRRRRYLRSRPSLNDKVRSLRLLSAQVKKKEDALQRRYAQICKEAWRTHADLVDGRKALSNLRRKELRLERAVETELEEGIGAEPTW